VWGGDIVRYGDTDLNGHVNNAAFLTYLETARTLFLLNPVDPVLPTGQGLAIVRLVMDYRAEMRWGASVEVGMAVPRIGRTSFTMAQGLFQHGSCVATAECVLVAMDMVARKATPIAGRLEAVLRAAAPPGVSLG
jgi:acyl-CoA thioester hydrolase